VEDHIVFRKHSPRLETAFYTERYEGIQVGHIVKKAGERVAPHRHKYVQFEFITVVKGATTVSFYNAAGLLEDAVYLVEGDSILIRDVIHGLIFTENTVLLEVKQGPFLGADEKEYLYGKIREVDGPKDVA